MDISVNEFGVFSGGDSLCHRGINRAINACAEAGGGTVRVPAGLYECGTIRLRSKVLVYLEPGARIVGTADLGQYEHFFPENHAEFHLRERWHRALILAEDVEDAGILGPGVIDGARVFDAEGEEGMRGPHTVLAGNSKRLQFRDFSIVDSANYAILAEYCDDLEFHSLRIRGGWDGIHIRGQRDKACERISIVGCDLQTGDDAIAGRYWRDTLISGCLINSSCNGIRLIGPAEGLSIHNNFFYGPGRYPHITQDRTRSLAGILLQPGAWDPTEGVLDGVLISRNTMRDLECAFAVQILEGNRCGEIMVEDLSACGLYGPAVCVESHTKQPIESVVLNRLHLRYTSGACRSEAMDNPNPLPCLGVRTMPAWGLYVRRVKKMQVEQLRLFMEGKDIRSDRQFVEVESAIEE